MRARCVSGSRGIVRVDSPGEVADAYEEVKREYGEPIIQEYVSYDSGHFSVGTLFDENSEPVAIHVYEELKQYSTSGGPAVKARSVPIERQRHARDPPDDRVGRSPHTWTYCSIPSTRPTSPWR